MYKNIFINWFENVFSGEAFRDDMVDTVEDSPYHREDNVWVHTEMVVDAYIRLSPATWSKKDLMGALMCAFHDVGKPASEEVKQRDNGTEYRRYNNHDTVSGNMFIDYYLQNKDQQVFSDLNSTDIYNIWVMIAYHMPYKIKQKRLDNLSYHMNKFGLVSVFTRAVYADAKGRISDDEEKTLKSSSKWCERFNKMYVEHPVRNDSKTVIVLCGCSGIGKSTLSEKLMKSYSNESIVYHSMDDLRLKWYSDDYRVAFEKASQDSDFGNKVTSDFMHKLKVNDIVLVDNTNLTYKRRNQYLNNNKNTVRIAYVLVASFDEVLNRQSKRTDKEIGYKSIERMYYSHRPVIYGEVDEVKLVGF